MQNFIDIPSTETLANSRQKLMENDKTIMSCHSGTTAPTTNLQVGMLFLNTSQMKLYQLKDLTPNWKLLFDLNKTAVDKEYVDTGLGNKVDRVSGVRPGVSKLYRRDNDSDFSVQINWTGTHWWLRGYSADTFHAEVKVGYADQAGNADTVNSIKFSMGATASANAGIWFDTTNNLIKYWNGTGWTTFGAVALA